jgi:hypothetical protein
MIVVDFRQEHPIRASDRVTSEPIKPQDPVTRTVFGLSPRHSFIFPALIPCINTLDPTLDRTLQLTAPE